MGDRVSCTLTVLAVHAEQAKELICHEEGEPSQEDLDRDFIYLEYDEVNYGEIDALKSLVQAGIAYTFNWGRGSGFDPGYRHVRFNELGEAIIVTEPEDGPANPDIYELMKLVDTPDALVAYVRKWAADHAVIEWGNQLEYGKRHLARQLLTQ